MIDLNRFADHPRVELPKGTWKLIGQTPINIIANGEEPIVYYVADDGIAPTTFDAVNNLGRVVGVIGSIIGRTIGIPEQQINSVSRPTKVYARGAYKDSSAVVFDFNTAAFVTV